VARRGGALGRGQSSPGFGRGVSSILVLIAAVWIGSGVYRSMRRSRRDFPLRQYLQPRVRDTTGICLADRK